MKSLDAHRKLMSLLCLVLVSSMGLVGLAGCGGSLLPEQNRSASPLQTYDQVVESFDQIVPGMTQAQDLPNLGFDAQNGHADVLSYASIEKRFLPAAGPRWEQLPAAVRACINAQVYCTGYVFHPGRAGDITLLVMNGRVVHKVFSGNPRA